MPKFKLQMPNQVQNPNDKYDLEERTAKFGEDVIEFAISLKKNDVNKILINQAIRSGTSVGANYCEADGAESKKDFQHKIGICKKESKETMHWLRMIAKANLDRTKECRKLWRESHELALYFQPLFVLKKSNLIFNH